MSVPPTGPSAPVDTTTNVYQGNNISLSALYMKVLGERARILDGQVRDHAGNIDKTNKEISKANKLSIDATGGGNSDRIAPLSLNTYQNTDNPEFTKKTLKNGDTFIDFGDGYGVVIENGDTKNRSWKIVQYDPDSVKAGEDPTFTKETRVWGDPHVDENTDGTTDWDFNQQSTFVLGNGVTITVETQDFGNGTTVSNNLYIARGNNQAVVTGLADNNQANGGDNDQIRVSKDGSLFNENIHNDGHMFVAKDGDVNDWTKLDGADIAQHEKVSQENVNREYQVLPATDYNQKLLEKAGIDTDKYVKGGVIIIPNEDMAEINKTLKSLYAVPADEGTVDLLKTIGIDVDDLRVGDMLVFSKSELEATLKGLDSYIESLTSSSQMEIIDLQATMDKYNQTYNLLTGLLGKDAKVNEGITGNIR